MTHFSPDGGATSQPPSTLTRPPAAGPALPHPLSGQMLLTLQIAFRRARLAELETEMVAACEASALGTRARANATSEHAHWDRMTWRRYLAAAMRLEAAYGPRMRRLRQEIGQLERLKTLLTAV